MVGAIGPHVQGKRQLRDSVGSVTLFTLGAVAGGLVTGSLVGVLGALVQALAGEGALAVAGRRGRVRVAAGRPGSPRPANADASPADQLDVVSKARPSGRLGALGIRPRPRLLDHSSQFPLLAPGAVRCRVRLAGARSTRLRSLRSWARHRVRGRSRGADAEGLTDAASPGLGLLRVARPVRLASDAFLGLVSITIVLTLGAPWW